MPSKIPPYIIDAGTRIQLGQINEHLEVLLKNHGSLMEKAKKGPLEADESALLRKLSTPTIT